MRKFAKYGKGVGGVKSYGNFKKQAGYI